MDVQKAFVRQDDTTIIKCPDCKTVRNINVAKFKETKKVLKVKCGCGTLFGVSLELRKMYRKETSLDGRCTNLSRENQSQPIKIKDVSMSGVGFDTVLSNHGINKDDELKVEFNLDDAKCSHIEKIVVVRSVRDKFVGCEFSNSMEYDKALGFYLMP
jgi:hypothetical protein